MIGYENESSAYFELKLTAHNFTFYNMVTQDAMAFWFDETQATFGASMFASCLCSYTTELLDQSLNTVILYSDGCGYQNRNAIFSNELLHISVTRKVTSVQKFLEKGHTQMECDSVHSTIERRYEHDDVYLPNQYVLHSISARRVPMPYRAKLLGFSFFEDFSQAASMLYSFIRAGTCVNCSTNLWETVSLSESEQGSPNPESVTECEPVASTSTSSSHENLATSAKHKSLPEVVAATSAYQEGGEKRGKLSDAILFMICRDDQPISIVDDEGFRYLMKTTDIWTDGYQAKSFLGVTAHIVIERNSQLQLESIIIGIKELMESHRVDGGKNDHGVKATRAFVLLVAMLPTPNKVRLEAQMEEATAKQSAAKSRKNVQRLKPWKLVRKK